MKSTSRVNVGLKGLVAGLACFCVVAAIAPAANAADGLRVEVVNHTGDFMVLFGEPSYYGGGLGGSSWAPKPKTIVESNETSAFAVSGAWFGETTAHVSYVIGNSSDRIDLEMQESGVGKHEQSCKVSSDAYKCDVVTEQRSSLKTRRGLPPTVVVFTITKK